VFDDARVLARFGAGKSRGDPSMQRIVVVAVIALSIDALTGFAGIGSATRQTPGPVKVISAIHFRDVSARPFFVKPGHNTGPGYHAKCPANTILVSGGYDVYPVTTANPATVTNSSRTGRDTWTVSVDNPPKGFTVTVDMFVTCATFVYTTVQGA
jgi:hypothetical protein